MKKMVCKECGGHLTWVDPTRWICPYCSTNYVVDAPRSVTTVRSPKTWRKMYSYSTSTSSSSTSSTSTTLWPYHSYYPGPFLGFASISREEFDRRVVEKSKEMKQTLYKVYCPGRFINRLALSGISREEFDRRRVEKSKEMKQTPLSRFWEWGK